MELKLFSWNIRGIRNLALRRHLRDLLRKRQVEVLCIQETKCSSNWDDKLKNSVWDLNSHDWIIQNSEGLSRGLPISWDSLVFKCKGFAQLRNWIWVLLWHIKDECFLNVVCIYAPQKPKLNKKTLETTWRN